jgi:hypothetical protein
MTLPRIALAAALLLSSGAAVAQSATDAGCILLSNAFAKNAKDANAQKAAEVSLYFYLGRIGGGMTATQLKALFDQQSKTITTASAPTMMSACVKAIQTKVDLLQSLAGPPPAQSTQPQPPKPDGR